MQVEQKKFDWASLALGIIFLLAAMTSFRVHPAKNVSLLVIIFTIIIVLKGIYMIAFRSWLKKVIDLPLTSMLLIGVIDILIGIYFLFNLRKGVMVASYVFAIWFITDSIFGLFELGWMSLINRPLYWLSLVTNIIGLIVGFMLMFDPVVSALTLSFLVGFYLMSTGIMFVVRAFR